MDKTNFHTVTMISISAQQSPSDGGQWPVACQLSGHQGGVGHPAGPWTPWGGATCSTGTSSMAQGWEGWEGWPPLPPWCEGGRRLEAVAGREGQGGQGASRAA